MDSWSIDYSSGRCVNPKGIEAFIGKLENCSYLPIIGPYTSHKFNGSLSEVANEAFELTIALECRHPHLYVVWGGLDTYYNLLPIDILDRQSHWIPDPSARSNWAYLASLNETDSRLPAFVQREFESNGEHRCIHHRTGITLNFADTCFENSLVNMFRNFTVDIEAQEPIDHSLWNAVNWDPGLHSLAQVAFKSLCTINGQNLAPRKIRLRQIQSAA